MLLYLSGHTCPNISLGFVVVVEISMFFTKHSNEEALRQIGRYLKLTWDRVLILNLNRIY